MANCWQYGESPLDSARSTVNPPPPLTPARRPRAARSFSEFRQTIEDSGMGAMEMFSMGLKAAGAYCCRTLSYTGAPSNPPHGRPLVQSAPDG